MQNRSAYMKHLEVITLTILCCCAKKKFVVCPQNKTNVNSNHTHTMDIWKKYKDEPYEWYLIDRTIWQIF